VGPSEREKAGAAQQRETPASRPGRTPGNGGLERNEGDYMGTGANRPDRCLWKKKIHRAPLYAWESEAL
jgi:hypothetical protein